jgi:hypothetical protein
MPLILADEQQFFNEISITLSNNESNKLFSTSTIGGTNNKKL